jgi:uncharacterized protein (TIGR02266 family)
MSADSPSDKAGSSPIERRTEKRVDGQIQVRFAEPMQAARAFRAYSLNLSVGGLCLKTQRRYEVGARLGLTLLVDAHEYHLAGVVAWERDGAIGVRFENLAQTDRERLADLVARFRP